MPDDVRKDQAVSGEEQPEVLAEESAEETGEEIELPRYDFPSGTSQKSGRKLRLDDDMILLARMCRAM